MRKRQNQYAWGLVLLSGSTLSAWPQSVTTRLMPVSKANLCVTEGTIQEFPGQGFSVNVPKMRAYLNAYTQPVAEARFTYFGPTPNEAPLASGEMRRQVGLKLRAQVACNLVYAMWRIEPESKLFVSVKSNPGQHNSAECANHGYGNIKPLHSKPLSALQPGATHDLRAQMNGEELKVFADNALVWEGNVGGAAASFHGPVGMRSDNARLELEVRAPQSPALPSNRDPGCRTGPGESE